MSGGHRPDTGANEVGQDQVKGGSQGTDTGHAACWPRQWALEQVLDPFSCVEKKELLVFLVRRDGRGEQGRKEKT